MTLNGEIIKMKGNYLIPPHPSTLQYLSEPFFTPSARASPSQAIHHIRHLIPPVLLFFSLFSMLPHNVLLPSSSQPFIPSSSLTSSFIISSLCLLCPPHLCPTASASPLSPIFYSSPFSPFLLLFLLLLSLSFSREPLN